MARWFVLGGLVLFAAITVSQVQAVRGVVTDTELARSWPIAEAQVLSNIGDKENAMTACTALVSTVRNQVGWGYGEPLPATEVLIGRLSFIQNDLQKMSTLCPQEYEPLRLVFQDVTAYGYFDTREAGG